MTKKPSSPTPYQQDQLFSGDQAPEGEATKASRPWFKKKRIMIPAGVLALFVVAGIAGGWGEEPTPAASTPNQFTASPSATESVALAEATASADDDAEEKAEESARAKASEEAEASAQSEAEVSEKAEAEAQAAEEARAAEEAAAEGEAEAGTLSQQNALRSAQNYLDFTAFSRTGLIGQLEFEEYSTEDATWAVDRVEVDWNEQAAKSAANYLDFTSFSRSGLVDQLIFEGFTPEQAEYGVSQTGL